MKKPNLGYPPRGEKGMYQDYPDGDVLFVYEPKDLSNGAAAYVPGTGEEICILDSIVKSLNEKLLKKPIETSGK